MARSISKAVTTNKPSKKLKERFDGDSKIAANDYLRPPCTLNWKSGAPRRPATERTGAPTETRLADPFEPRRVKPYAFADELGIDLSNICTTNGQAAGTGAQPDVPGAGDAPESVEMGDYPWIRETLDEPHPDRSTHINHVVREVYCAGLSIAQARWVVNQRDDLVAKLAELSPRDDVLESWKKIQDEWPNRRFRVAAIIAANTPKGDGKAKKSGWTFVDGAAFILDIPATIPALWGKGDEVLWAEGESLMIAAPLGLGKTTLGTLLLRAQLGIGDASLLGYPVPPRGGKILYLAMDRPAQVARAMHRQFAEDERQTLAERLVFWKGPPPGDVARKPELLAELAEAAGAETVYLDSIKDAAIGLSDDEVGSGYNRARQHLLTQGVQLCEQHHTVKRAPKGGPPVAVADIYGSAWITNGTGSIILLTGDPGDPIVGFLHLRAPADIVGPYKLIHDQTAGTFNIYHSTDLVVLASASGLNGLTAKDAAVAIFDTTNPTSSQIEKARRKLNALITHGLYRVDGGKGTGNTTVWFPTT